MPHRWAVAGNNRRLATVALKYRWESVHSATEELDYIDIESAFPVPMAAERIADKGAGVLADHSDAPQLPVHLPTDSAQTSCSIQRNWPA